MPLDPYHRWLGIPSEEQPADHYRLLGLARFERNESVIKNAVQRQMAHVRTYQLGKHAELSQKLLNELADAKSVLLGDKRDSYEAELGRMLQPASREASRETHSKSNHWAIVRLVSAWLAAGCAAFLLLQSNAHPPDEVAAQSPVVQLDNTAQTPPKLKPVADVVVGAAETSRWRLIPSLKQDSSRNTELRYSLSPETADVFKIDSKTGELSFVESAKPAAREYEVAIRVVQAHAPYLGDEVRFKVTLSP